MHEDAFRRYLGTLPDDQYMRDHLVRFVETWVRLEPYILGERVFLELGPLSPVGLFLRDSLGKDVSSYEKDLRYPYELGDATADVILSLEVVEHLNDAHSPTSSIGEIAAFTMSGARRMFSESRRILRAGGLLFLTTPNAMSLDAVGNVLNKRHPFHYPPHVREYAVADVVMLASEAGFARETRSTFFAWEPWPDVDRRRLSEAFEAMGFDMSDRGNDAFYGFRKPRLIDPPAPART
jgi:SAM-dependent methyltransferase